MGAAPIVNGVFMELVVVVIRTVFLLLRVVLVLRRLRRMKNKLRTK
jgi:hypothetical protein